MPGFVSSSEDLALHLSTAIELGDEEEAMRCATLLAQQHAALRILLKESCYPTSEIRWEQRAGQGAGVSGGGWVG